MVVTDASKPNWLRVILPTYLTCFGLRRLRKCLKMGHSVANIESEPRTGSDGKVPSGVWAEPLVGS